MTPVYRWQRHRRPRLPKEVLRAPLRSTSLVLVGPADRQDVVRVNRLPFLDYSCVWGIIVLCFLGLFSVAVWWFSQDATGQSDLSEDWFSLDVDCEYILVTFTFYYSYFSKINFFSIFGYSLPNCRVFRLHNYSTELKDTRYNQLLLIHFYCLWLPN